MTNTHTERDFGLFLTQLKETNAKLNFFVDFEKVSRNINEIEFELNKLNYLIGKPDMEEAIRFIWEHDKEAFSVLEIIIAVRNKDKKKVITENGEVVFVESYLKTVEGVITFIEETGLKDVLQSRKIKNLVDYVFGVEVGLDSNTRKNRSGDFMANKIASILDSFCIPYKREVNSTIFPRLNILGKDKKRFDFVITTHKKTYLIEVNFYSSGGSKLNEVARSYSDIGPKINSLSEFEFVWITDGQGWYSAKNKLEEAYSIIPSVYNLTTINNFINKIKSEL